MQDGWLERPVGFDSTFEYVQLGFGREPTIDEKVGGFFETSVLGEVIYAVAAIEELARFSVDKTDLTLFHVHIVKPFVNDNGFFCGRQFYLNVVLLSRLYKLLRIRRQKKEKENDTE